MIKALLVEDEDLAYHRLAQLISDVDKEIRIVGRTISIEETTDFLRKNEIDLMFLDINLSDGYSFKIFEYQLFNTPPIIFTTAYSEFAIKAFQLNSISYLLKPIKEEELITAIQKFKHLKVEDSTRDKYMALMDYFLHPYKERFLVKINQKLETISIKDIAYFYAEDKLTFIMLKEGRSLPIDSALKTIEQELNPKEFYRINRKYIIHYNSIQDMHYTSKSKIKVNLLPKNKNDNDLNFVAIEKVGQFKKWLAR